MTNKAFKNHVEMALNDGRALIVDGILDEFDPGLDSVISQAFTKVGTRLQVSINQQETMTYYFNHKHKFWTL